MRFTNWSIWVRSVTGYMCFTILIAGSSAGVAQTDECRTSECVEKRIQNSFNCSDDEMLVESLSVSEMEVNIFLTSKNSLLDQRELRDVRVELLGDGRMRIDGTITVKMESLPSQQRLGALRLLDGRSVYVRIDLSIETSDGQAVVMVEEAEVGGLRLPSTVVEHLLSSMNFEVNKLFTADGGFELPCGVRDVVVNDKTVVFVR